MDAARHEPAVNPSAGGVLYNHICPPLSDLDLEIVRCLPEGGNWTDIPAKTARKSARLMQIRASGGRTTYYGRLQRDCPSYTVSTYFHRPGNGSFVHPTQDRMISLREAARLQSFPDRYRFFGSKSSIYKQIGNAVPPLLARAVGQMLPGGSAVDLFSGAGGLSEGLVQSGHNVIVASDLARDMCNTYAANHASTAVVQADLSTTGGRDEVVRAAENLLRGRTLNLLAGGPPCQGFSMAGKWNQSDTRNSLVHAMIEVSKVLAPRHVLIENVLGLNWMANGSVIKKVTAEMSKLGYATDFMVLRSEQFGVPQRRRRVFLLGSKKASEIQPLKCWFSPVTNGRKKPESAERFSAAPVTVDEAIGDLPPVPSGGGVPVMEYDSSWAVTDYQRLSREHITFEEFLRRRGGRSQDGSQVGEVYLN